MILRPTSYIAALLAVLALGCISSTPGVVRTSSGNPLVTIGAGLAEISGAGDGWRVWYVIDTKTQTCWIKLGDSGAGMDCCALRRVPEATSHITWENDASCTAAVTPPASAPVGAAPVQ